MSKALLKIKRVKRPISEQVIGFRIQAAHPNCAGRNRQGDAIPSFAPKYLIAESSDYGYVDDRRIKEFVKGQLIEFQGFNDFEIVSDQRD